MSLFEQASSQNTLRSNLVEHYHFEALYPSVWAHLYSWFSADAQVMRLLKVDPINEGYQSTKTLDLESDRRFDR